jgi:hypothetical protein
LNLHDNDGLRDGYTLPGKSVLQGNITDLDFSYHNAENNTLEQWK